MNLIEVITSPYAAARWKWSYQSPSSWIGQFILGEKTYTVSINEKKENDSSFYDVTLTSTFYTSDGKPIVSTNAGDATVVLTTLAHMVNEFAHHAIPEKIVVHPGDWRLKTAYKDRFSKMFAGWKVTSNKDNTISIKSKT